jgi:hypothetical protein
MDRPAIITPGRLLLPGTGDGPACFHITMTENG